jgi:hypothetical protein
MIVALTLVLLPVAPATAVVAISAPPRAAPAMPIETNARPDDTGPFGMTFGELAAAITGLAVLALMVVSRRQPHSVTA